MYRVMLVNEADEVIAIPSSYNFDFLFDYDTAVRIVESFEKEMLKKGYKRSWIDEENGDYIPFYYEE